MTSKEATSPPKVLHQQYGVHRLMNFHVVVSFTESHLNFFLNIELIEHSPFGIKKLGCLVVSCYDLTCSTTVSFKGLATVSIKMAFRD